MTREVGLALKADVLFYMNISNTSTALYGLCGEGITSFEGATNPETEDTQYIHQRQKTTITKSLTPSYAITADVLHGDPVNDFLYNLGLDQTMNEKVELVRVEMKNPATNENEYHCTVGTYSLTLSLFDGGAGGEKIQMGADLRQEGEIKKGIFNIDTETLTLE